MNGDITPTGQQSQYDDVKRVLNKISIQKMYGLLLGIMSFMLEMDSRWETLSKYMAKWCN